MYGHRKNISDVRTPDRFNYPPSPSPSSYSSSSSNSTSGQNRVRGAARSIAGVFVSCFTPPEDTQHHSSSVYGGYDTFSSTSGADYDVIPETQPSNKKAAKGIRRVQEERTSTKAESIPWSPVELEALARAWVNVSTDPITGTNRRTEGFWNQVCVEFFKLIQREPYRKLHSVSTKFREISAKCQTFAGFYQHAWNNRPSGADDESVLATAIHKFSKKHGSWGYMKPYEILTSCPKWKVVPNEVSQAKRLKTNASGNYNAGGSDARGPLNINDDPEFEDEAPTPESERPIGRNRAKKAVASKASSSSEVSKLDLLIQNFNEFKHMQTEKNKKREKEKEEAAAREMERLELDRKRLQIDQEKLEKEEFRIMTTNIDHLPVQEREVVKRMKDKIAKKWLGGNDP